MSNFIDVSWQLTFVLLGKLSNGLQYHYVQGEYYYTHTLHLLHHGRTSSFGRVLDECNVFFTYFSGIREIFLMLFVWFFFFVRMKVKKLPKILALHLKRFKYMEQLQRYAKLSYRVVFPFELRLFNTVSIIDYWH